MMGHCYLVMLLVGVVCLSCCCVEAARRNGEGSSKKLPADGNKQVVKSSSSHHQQQHSNEDGHSSDHDNHDHHHHHHHHHSSNETATAIVNLDPAYFMTALFNNTNSMSKEDLQSLLSSLQSGWPYYNNADGNSTLDEHRHNETDDEEQKQCLTIDQLLKIYGISSENSISAEQFPLICPALVQQHVSKSCRSTFDNDDYDDYDYDHDHQHDHHHDHHHHHRSKPLPELYERYGYGTVSIFIISYVPLVILILIPDVNNPRFPYAMHCLVGLAIATMMTDAMLHLLPAAFGVHSHSHGGASGEEGDDHDHHHHDHDHDHGHHHEEGGAAEFTPATKKGAMFLFAIYVMYLLEMIIGTRPRVAKGIPSKSNNNGHSHGISLPTISSTTEKTSETTQMNGNHYLEDVCSLSPRHHGNNAMSELPAHRASNNNNEPLSLEKTITEHTKSFIRDCVPPKTLGWMMILADAIHNFMDGIAVGATFSMGLTDGICTSLAILFHEIPHEIGDFAALLSTGLSWRGCMVWNVIDTFTAFIGLYIGLAFSTSETSQQYAYAITAGIFILVSLNGLLPELNEIKEKFWTFFALQNVGIHIGFWTMFLIAVYEGSMEHMLD